ncbi:2916_t:CDS:2 [Funneliformis mosseae]|uniref:2916_t:CDS:1 n=1 Tax=Funneliformis mosseae TaxID=27381 RepID=A0A9N8VJV3_FUNMO|nr:2916_t:CDS:2 [Funneliformis mosseae]
MVRTRGRKFKPSERYTNRLNKILVEYPDGPQVLREILQNSDDSKSTEQIFILDHNTYPSESLLEPIEDNYHNSDLKLDRYQGPALLAINNTIFEERDFTSLLNLANSEKRDQFDKIGVMGVGFNSIYHVTDSPSFITGDTYVILDPHEWYFDGGEIYDIVEDNMVQDFPDQLAPFKIPSLGISCENSFNRFDGTMFRYPLRTEKDSQDSEIYKKIYKPKEVLEMFHKFYENESINCLLFLKYVEKITFYELKKGATKPDLLYEIRLENAVQVREQRRLIVKNIVTMMDSLISGKRNDIKQLESSYVASFRRKRGNEKGDSDPWLILNYLDDLLEAEKYYQKNFSKSIGEHKFIPNVGLAVPLNNLDATGRLFCFLPLPISMPFLVSVHGYFAVSTNRRSLWAPADNEDLASDAIARLKVSWNQYLFEKVLPKAWVKFLRELPRKVPNISSDHLYKFWPKDKGDTSGTMNHFCKDLLQNVIEHLSIKDRVFRGPSSLNNAIGKVSGISADSYDASSFQASEFHWLSLANGYLNDNMTIDLSTVGSVGFPIISAPFAITKGLKKSKHKTSRKIFAPAILRDYLKHNPGRWQSTLAREEVLKLFGYLLRDEKFDELVDFRMIPLADGTFGKLSQSSNSLVYIVPYNINSIDRDEFNVFNDQLNKFIDMSISYELYDRLYKLAKDGWILNIKILDEFAVADMIRFTLNSKNVKSEEINHNEWIYKLWDNLSYRRWDLKEFENVHLIPTSRSTLRRLKTPQRIFYHQPSSLISIFEKFGAVFVNKQFDKVVERDGVSSYIIKPKDIVSVLSSFRAAASYPRNLEHDLQPREASILIDHLSNYLRLTNNLAPELIEVIKHLPIFTVVDQNSPISLLSGNANWFLLPKNEENSYGKIIYPSNRGRFLNASSQNLCYLLEYIIKVPRLESYNYWRNYVMPFLGSQQQGDRDSVIDKLFDKLPNLLYHHSELRDFFGNIPFVPTGTLQMSQQQQLPNNFKLAKPVELFNPEEKSVVDLFFENEKFFPAGKYGSGKFFSNLKSLGLKIILSPDDIISRIKNIVARSSNVNETLIRQQALKLLKYLDDKWGQLIINDHLMYVILNEKWIPTVDKSQNEIFSKPQDCYPKRDKNLVCFVAPILDYSVKNREFSKRIGWNTYPSVNLVLEQLKFCCVSLARKQPPEELTTVSTVDFVRK